MTNAIHSTITRRAALTGTAAGAAAIVAGAGSAFASHPDDDLRRQLRSLLDYLRTDTKCTVGTHYDRQMIGNEIMAMLGEGGEPWESEWDPTPNQWGIPEFRGRLRS